MLHLLPCVLLQKVLLQVSLEDRVRVQCVSKQLLLATRSSALAPLWESLDLAGWAPERLAAAVAWVASMRRSLGAVSLPASSDGGVATAMLLGALAGSSLTSLRLSLHLPDDSQLDSCLFHTLSRLQQLSLHSCTPCELTISAGFSQLAALTRLHVCSCSPTFAAACLPRGLRELHVQDCLLWELPPQVLGAPPLRTLHLHGLNLSSTAIDLRGLERLASLTSLSLRASGLRSMPPALSALTRLRALDLGDNTMQPGGEEIAQQGLGTVGDQAAEARLFDWRPLTRLTALSLRRQHLGGAPCHLSALTGLVCLDLAGNSLGPDDAGEALGCLTRLTWLCLAGCGLSYVPWEVQQLRRLEVLDVGQNSLDAPLPRALRSARLQELSVDFACAAQSAGTLSRMSSLHKLHLWVHLPLASCEEWAQLTQAVCSLQQLDSLRVGVRSHNATFQAALAMYANQLSVELGRMLGSRRVAVGRAPSRDPAISLQLWSSPTLPCSIWEGDDQYGGL